MARYQSAEEVREQHIATMGPELGPVYHQLWYECAWLHTKWHQYVELFGSNPDRIKLLNGAAGTFFRIVQDTLWEDTLLHLARLTDRRETGSKSNLTVKRLPGLVDDAHVRTEVEALVKQAAEKTAFATDWRNRRIAHRDLALALKEGAEPLKPASRLLVKEALEAVAAILQRIALHYEKAELSFEEFGDAGDALSLLYVVQDGLVAEERRRKRLKDGKLDPEDLDGPRPI